MTGPAPRPPDPADQPERQGFWGPVSRVWTPPRVGRIEIDLIAAYPPSGTKGHARAALEREQVRGIWTEFAAAWAGPARTDLTRLRGAYEQLCQRRAPSAGVRAQAVDADGVQCLRIGDNRQRVILFAHGGGFTLGSAQGYVGAARTLAAAAEADVALVPDYHAWRRNTRSRRAWTICCVPTVGCWQKGLRRSGSPSSATDPAAV